MQIIRAAMRYRRWPDRSPWIRAACLHDSNGLRMTIFIDEKFPLLLHNRMAHSHRFGGGGRFIQQRRIRQWQTRQVGHHRLKIQQRFESPLRDLRLIGRVLRVPSRILQDVPQDYRRSDAIVICPAQFVQRFSVNFVFSSQHTQAQRSRFLALPARFIESRAEYPANRIEAGIVWATSSSRELTPMAS